MNAPDEKAVIFQCGGASLLGVVHRAHGSARPEGILIVVGGPQYRVGSHRQFVIMARALARSGYDVFRFDYRGMGDSGGQYAGFEQCGDDIRAAIDAFFAQCPHLRGIHLFGLCDGASAALMYAPTDDRVIGLVLANPWVRSESTQASTYLRHYYLRRLLDRSFWKKLASGGVRLGKSLGELAANLQQARARSAAEPFVARMLSALQSLTVPILVLISEADLTAKEFSDVCENDRNWRDAIGRKNVTVELLAGADHTFSARPTLELAMDVWIRWLRLRAWDHGTRSWQVRANAMR